MTKKFSFMKFEGYTEIGEGETVPMSKKLTTKELAVLQVIAMFQGHGGICDTTQEQMSQMLDISTRTVSTTIKSLSEFTYEGKPVIEVSQRTSKTGKKQNVYRLLENKLFGIYGEQPKGEFNVKSLHEKTSGNDKLLHEETSWSDSSLHEEIACTKETSNSKEIKNLKNIIEEEEESMSEIKNTEIIATFLNSYEKKYSVEYKRNYSMDNKFTTQFKKTVSDLKNNEIKRLVEIIVENYESWSSNTAKYPLTIRTLSLEWVQSKARTILEQEKDSESQMVKQTVEGTKRNEQTLSSLMARFGKKEDTE